MKKENEKKSFGFFYLFLIAFSTLLVHGCNSDERIDANKLSIVSMVATMNADSWPMPELSEKEETLVDSISKLDEFVNYHAAYQQLIKKTSSYFANLDSEELEALTKNGTDSVFLSNFMKKMCSRINIETELKAVEKAEQIFDKKIMGVELTEGEKIALIIKRFK